jgi:hypothetical protein
LTWFAENPAMSFSLIVFDSVLIARPLLRRESWMHVAVNPAFTLPILSGQWPKCGRDRRRPMAS